MSTALPNRRSWLADAVPTPAAWVGLAFLAAAFGLGRLGLPDVLQLAVAVGSAAVGVWILLRHRPSDLAVGLGIVVALAMAVPALLGLASGQPILLSQLSFAIAIGVSVWAAALLPPATVRWSSIGVLSLVCWAGIAAGILAELGLFSYGLYVDPAQDRALFGLDQLRGVMPHPNTMGIFAGLAFALALRQLVTDRQEGLHDRRRFLGLLLLALLPAALALIWSQSRTSAVAAGCGVVVGLLPLSRKGWHYAAPVIVAVAGLMITVPVIISESLGYDFNGRGMPWTIAQTDFELSPITGGGPRFLSAWYEIYPNLPWRPETAHNMLMQAVGEAGLLGLITLALLILTMGYVAVRAVPFDKQWAMIIVVTFCLLGGQESTLSLPVRSALVVQFAILGASAVLVSRGSGSEATDRTAPAAPRAA